MSADGSHIPGGAAEPMAQVRAWFDAAREAGVHEPEAAALATASPDGRPSVRIVLIRGIDERGISWYTNRESRKGRELAANPRASVAFHWAALERQVRLEGPVELLSDEDVQRARTLRREDLPGNPLAWQVALRTLVGQLTGS